MTLSGVLPENTKPRFRAALTRAPSSWKQIETQNVTDKHTKPVQVHTLLANTALSQDNLEFAPDIYDRNHLAHKTSSSRHIFTMRAVNESCGSGSWCSSLHEEAAGREKALCLLFTVHLTTLLFAANPRSASNPKAPEDPDCFKQSGKKSLLSYQKHNVRWKAAALHINMCSLKAQSVIWISEYRSVLLLRLATLPLSSKASGTINASHLVAV